MNRIKYGLATAGTAIAFMAGAVAPVAAHGGEVNDSFNKTKTVNVDKSQTVNGDCSAIQVQDVYQDQNSETNQVNVGGNVSVLPIANDGSQNTDQSNSSNTNQTQSNTQSFSADCSTVTNVTNVQQAQAQVEAPKGGVDAGAGGFGALVGLGGSLTTAGYGVLRLRRR